MNFWKAGQRAGHSLLSSTESLFHYEKHAFVEAYGLNYWPSVSCLCFFPAADSLPPPPVGSGNTAYVARGTELNLRDHESSASEGFLRAAKSVRNHSALLNASSKGYS
jgi:hypothetical protein